MVAFALVGCGHIAQRDLKIFANKELAGSGLTAVCDVDEQRARAAGESFGLPWFTDMHRMMREMDGKIDIVSLLTENGSHAGHCIALAPYGKHIMVEKPMALTLEDADAMVQACDASGSRLFVVKQARYNRAIRRLKDALDQGRFGKLVSSAATMRWTRDQKYYDQAAWRGTRARDGGVFANQAAHLVDLMQWCMGQPVSVFAKARTALVNIEVEDTGAAIIGFQNGAIGTIEATTAARPRGTEGTFSILGEKGLVEIGGMGADQIVTWNFAEPRPGDEDALASCKDPSDIYGVGRVAFLADIVNSVASNTPSSSDGAAGRATVELVSAIYKSIDQGKEISLPAPV
jgi:UDP-N-acetyl-2-amino-2-deoxyglucuronate dehydrogenase